MDNNVQINDDALVSGESIISLYKGLPESLQDIVGTLLNKRGISNLKQGNWYKLNAFVSIIEEIDSIFGSQTIYEIGKEVLNTALIADPVKNLVQAFDKYQITYNMNHRNSECIFFVMESNTKKKRIQVSILNPYPFHINRGLLTSLARKYPPKKGKIPEVTLDEAKSVFPKGIYNITW
ncbi:MAG: hypothetical protein JEZ09_13580 [Salinivirgaceae bacterium]|nr:hypothetical protein [Salinivirgaceae bacterium]